VLRLHAALCGDLWPDLTLLLLPDFERSLERARRRNARGKGPDESRFEREDERFYRRVFDKYRELAAREPQRVVVIEGDGGIEEVYGLVVEAVAQKLESAARP
jgi:dTMP kinase